MVKQLASVTSTGLKTAVDLSNVRGAPRDLTGAHVFSVATGWTGTVTVEVSPDGTNFYGVTDPAGTAVGDITAAVSKLIAGTALQARVNCSAFTAGTLVVSIEIPER